MTNPFPPLAWRWAAAAFGAFGLLLLATGYAQAQIQVDRDAITIIDEIIAEGDQYFNNREIVPAAEKYEEGLARDPDNFYLAYRLGRCLWYMDDLDSAITLYQRAIEIDPDGDDMIYFDLGLAMKKQGQCFYAKQQFNKFNNRRPGVRDLYFAQSTREIQGCDSVVAKYEGEQHPWKIDVVDAVNTKYDDFNPTPLIMEEDSFLIFTSHREKSLGSKQYYTGPAQPYSDLWVANFVSPTVLQDIENMGKKVNSKANDGSAVVDTTTMTMFYTICGGGKLNKVHGCDIYQSSFNREAKTWGKRIKTPGGVNGSRKVKVNSRGKTKTVPTYDAQPFLTGDGNTMFFISDRHCPAEGPYNTDIYFAERIGSTWGEPQALDTSVNTEFNEQYPTISPDGTKLYFSSDGHPGYGGIDLFMAEGRGAIWNKPVNLGPPLNSSYDDLSMIWIVPDSSGYFASNRPGFWGRYDIFQFVYVERPPTYITVHGTVRDKKTRQVVPFAEVVRYEILNDGSLLAMDTFKTDQTGYYQFVLEPEKDYKLLGNAPDYFPNEEFITTRGIEASDSVDLEQDIDIFLERIDIGKPIRLPNVYFDFDKPGENDPPPYRQSLRPETIAELDRLIKLLNINPGITIQIGSHTDTNGSEEYNIRLSDRRSQAVVAYLIENGVERDRLRAFGYGESQPLIYPELTDQDEQLNRRSEFRVQSTDYSIRTLNP